MISDAAETLLKGGVVAMRTDTIYGLLALAGNELAVERIYAMKGRDDTKSPIVLIGDIAQLFSQPSAKHLEGLQEFWPGKVSVIMPHSGNYEWLTRGNESIAYRLPDSLELRSLLIRTGPLIAPSANPQGKVPACTIAEARDYFGDKVDMYIDGGKVEDNTPSRLIRFNNDGTHEVLR